MLSELVSALRLNPVEQVGVVAHFSELHQNIVVVLHTDRVFRRADVVNQGRVASDLSQKGRVEVELHG